jgi:hypothetical protein
MMDTFAWMLLFTYLFGCCIEVLCFPVALVTEEARERPESGASRGWHRRRFWIAAKMMLIIIPSTLVWHSESWRSFCVFFGGYKNGDIMGISWCNMIGYEFMIFNDTLRILYPMDFMDSNGGCDVSVTSLK